MVEKTRSAKPDLTRVGLSTRAVHAGTERGSDIRPVVPPIHPSVAYLPEDPDDLRAVLSGEQEGYVYSRNGNPTVAALRESLAALEGAGDAVAFASGMAAIHATLLAVGVVTGTTVVASRLLYGVTVSLLNTVFVPMGVRVVYADLTNLDEAREVIEREQPLVVYCETISNPTLRLTDLPQVADIAHANGAVLLVDNTFATPLLVRPLELGADVSIMSTTKHLSGHGDVIGGAAAGAWDVCGRISALGVYIGGIAGPFEAWLTLRGIRTLGLRMPRQCATALSIARMLEAHPRVACTHYPGLPSHPQHELATNMLGGNYGGLVAFELVEDTVEAASRVLGSLKLCLPATSLGDVFTLMLHPVNSSHLTMSPEERAKVGVKPGLLRVSAGIEDEADILEDLRQALDQV
ncbi:MAG: PLP-dependent aspartate aminotransferase family protein [Chloroflexota bacterium]|nr:PLP-dependent aspartate aminotransferase family protein [Chloroflexota bacterium]